MKTKAVYLRLGDISRGLFNGLWHTSRGRGNSLTQIIMNVLEETHLVLTSGIWRPPLVLLPARTHPPSSFCTSPLLCDSLWPNFYSFMGWVYLHSYSCTESHGPRRASKSISALKIINLVEEQGLPVTCSRNLTFHFVLQF